MFRPSLKEEVLLQQPGEQVLQWEVERRVIVGNSFQWDQIFAFNFSPKSDVTLLEFDNSMW